MDRRKFLQTATGIAAAVTLAAGIATVSATQAADFSGKKIELIVPYGEGGGSSIHARLFAPLLEKHLPGNPTIIIKNIPGGGSVKGINQFFQSAKPDGLTIASIATGTFFQYVLEDPAVQYPLPEFRPFLTSPFGVIVYARKDAGLTGDVLADIKHLQANPPVYGGASATSSDLPALFAIDMLGIKPRTVFGLSNSETQQAFERGEVSLNYDNAASWHNSVKPMVDAGIAVPLFTFGFEDDDGRSIRDPILPDVPTFFEVYEQMHGKELDGTAKQVWDALFNIRVMGSKMFVLPPGTPDDIVQAYRDAAQKIISSPELNTPEVSLILADYPQRNGVQSERILASGSTLDAETKLWLKNWLRDTHEVQ